MAKLVRAPPKFAHPEWTYSNHANYDSAEKQRASSERLRAESDRLIDETEEMAKRTQRDVNKKFGKDNLCSLLVFACLSTSTYFFKISYCRRHFRLLIICFVIMFILKSISINLPFFKDYCTERLLSDSTRHSKTLFLLLFQLDAFLRESYTS